MTPRARICQVITRLLLSVAVLMCVLGLAEGGAGAEHSGGSAFAASMPMPMPMPMPMTALDVRLAGVGDEAGFASVALPASPKGGGHAGHGDSEGAHVVNCMVSTGALAMSVLALPGVAGPALIPAAPATRLRSAMLAVRYPRPPDRATLCVQRV
jgi:hypothetical protein